MCLAVIWKKNMRVCAIGEYCTQEVAEHTMAMLRALDRNLKVYARTVDKEHRWQYYAAPTPMGLHGSTHVSDKWRSIRFF